MSECNIRKLIVEKPPLFLLWLLLKLEASFFEFTLELELF